MPSWGSGNLRSIVQVLITILCLLHTQSGLAQELRAPLALHLGPGIGFPVNIEFPSGTYIDITQRRNDWLLIQDERGEGGWAKIADVGHAGGLKERLAWRLRELKYESAGNLVGRWFNHELGNGLALGWKVAHQYGYWQGEVERSSDADAYWQGISAWYISQHGITARTYYSAGIGLGYAQENAASEVLKDMGKANDTLFAGFEVALGIRPVKQLETGLSLRYLLAASSADADSTVISLYWSFEI